MRDAERRTTTTTTTTTLHGDGRRRPAADSPRAICSPTQSARNAMQLGAATASPARQAFTHAEQRRRSSGRSCSTSARSTSIRRSPTATSTTSTRLRLEIGEKHLNGRARRSRSACSPTARSRSKSGCSSAASWRCPATWSPPGLPAKLAGGATRRRRRPPQQRRAALAEWVASERQPAHRPRDRQPRLAVALRRRASSARPTTSASRGDRPTHPELLDWLAVEFVEHGWSLKHLHRRDHAVERLPDGRDRRRADARARSRTTGCSRASSPAGSRPRWCGTALARRRARSTSTMYGLPVAPPLDEQEQIGNYRKWPASTPEEANRRGDLHPRQAVVPLPDAQRVRPARQHHELRPARHHDRAEPGADAAQQPHDAASRPPRSPTGCCARRTATPEAVAATRVAARLRPRDLRRRAARRRSRSCAARERRRRRRRRKRRRRRAVPGALQHERIHLPASDAMPRHCPGPFGTPTRCSTATTISRGTGSRRSPAAWARGRCSPCSSATAAPPSSRTAISGDPRRCAAIRSPPSRRISRPRRSRVIFLMMAGGPSQMETFDPKPALNKLAGAADARELRQDSRAVHRRHQGAAARLQDRVQELRPVGHADLRRASRTSRSTPTSSRCIRSCHHDAFNHSPAQYVLTTGMSRLGYPERRRVGHVRPGLRVGQPAGAWS